MFILWLMEERRCQMEKMEIKVVPLSCIKPYYNNPRDNSAAVAPTAESISRYGFVKPIMCDSKGVIICGHTRFLAALRLGLENVPVVFSDMSDEKAKQYRIADNKIAEKSEFDQDEMIDELRNLEVPEDMQAFFFEDVRSMLDFDINVENITHADYSGGVPDDSSDCDGLSENEAFDGHSSGQSVDESDDSANVGIADEIYKVRLENGIKVMTVICPYCGKIEKVEVR